MKRSDEFNFETINADKTGPLFGLHLHASLKLIPNLRAEISCKGVTFKVLHLALSFDYMWPIVSM